jgi:hypothetical protein
MTLQLQRLQTPSRINRRDLGSELGLECQGLTQIQSPNQIAGDRQGHGGRQGRGDCRPGPSDSDETSSTPVDPDAEPAPLPKAINHRPFFCPLARNDLASGLLLIQRQGASQSEHSGRKRPPPTTSKSRWPLQRVARDAWQSRNKTRTKTLTRAASESQRVQSRSRPSSGGGEVEHCVSASRGGSGSQPAAQCVVRPPSAGSRPLGRPVIDTRDLVSLANCDEDNSTTAARGKNLSV